MELIIMKKSLILVFLCIFPSLKSEEAIFTEKEEEYLIFLEEIEVKASRHGIYNDLEALQDTFRVKVDSFLMDCKSHGIELLIVESYRTPERQDSLKRRGKSTLSGGKSKHQHGLAIDVVPIVNGKAQWHNYKLWKKVGKIAEKYDLFHGARWKRFKDYPHFEYKTKNV